MTLQLPTASDRKLSNLRHLDDNYAKTVLTANRMDVGNVAGIQIEHVVDWLLAAD